MMKLAGVAACALGLNMAAHAQMPDNLAEQIRKIGPVIDPPRTAQLYSPLHQVQTSGDVSVVRDVRYGSDPRQALDVFSKAMPPSSALRPVVVFVHGGGYVAGAKTAPGSPFYDNVMQWALAHGMVGVNVTYRLAPQHPWPAARDDVTGALEWIGRNITASGGDPKRLYVIGHSAGATHVATMLADEGSRKAVRAAGAELAGAVLLSAVYDLEAFPAAANQRAYFGADASLYAQRSPAGMLGSAGVPLFIATAELDPPEFRDQYNRQKQLLCERAQCPVALDQPGHSHMSEIYALGTSDGTLSLPLLKFMADTSSRAP